MAWSGTGQFNRLYTWTADAAAGIRIRADRMDGEFNNYKAGLENCLTRSGETIPTTDIPWGGFRLTTLADAVAAQDAMNAKSVQSGRVIWGGTSAGAANAYEITLSPVLAAYTTGIQVFFRSHQTNTGASTLKIGGLAATNIVKADSSSLSAGDISNNTVYGAIYDGSVFRLAGGGTGAVIPDGSITTAKLDDGIFHGLTAVSIAPDDYWPIADTSDSNKKKKALVSGLINGFTAVTPASGDYIAIADTSDSGNAKKVLASDLAVLLSTQLLLHIQDQKTSGVNGGTFTAGANRTRDLTTVITNEIPGASLGSNQITLPAGSYYIEVRAPAFYVAKHQAYLRNITDGLTTLTGSSTAVNFLESSGSITDSCIQGKFTIASSKVFEVQHRCSATFATFGFGQSTSFGPFEVYTDVRIWKLA
jgi:hypothetical protein